MRAPDYQGGGLVNLVAELEYRLTGSAASPRLYREDRSAIPDARTYVLVLFDGLGAGQLGHSHATRLRADLAETLDAPFSTQTSVSTATIASGLPPSQHGLISYLLKLPGGVVNTLWWYYADGSEPEFDLGGFLPKPMLSERLAVNGGETLVIQPTAFGGGPVEQVLYRSTTVLGIQGIDARLERTLAEAAQPGRLIVHYVPDIDSAAHGEGFGSDSYLQSLDKASDIWDRLASGMPDGAALIGTADHGMVTIERHIPVRPPSSLTFAGDGRVLHVHGPHRAAAAFAATLPATWVPFEEASDWWGPPPYHPEFSDRAPDSLILAGEGVAFHHDGTSIEFACDHGGITEAELRIPVLVGKR